MPVSLCPPDQPCRRSEAEEVGRNEGRGYAHTDRIVFQHAHRQRGTGTGEGVEVTRHGHGDQAHVDDAGLGCLLFTYQQLSSSVFGFRFSHWIAFLFGKTKQ